MAKFIYDGPDNRLWLGRGIALEKGVETELRGEAAEAAEDHPAVRKAKSHKSDDDK